MIFAYFASSPVGVFLDIHDSSICELLGTQFKYKGFIPERAPGSHMGAQNDSRGDTDNVWLQLPTAWEAEMWLAHWLEYAHCTGHLTSQRRESRAVSVTLGEFLNILEP